MSVWCEVTGVARQPLNEVSIRRLIKDMFDECGGASFRYENGCSYFEFSFCDDGLSAAKAVDVFASVLRARRVHCDIEAKIRFLT